MKIKAQVVGLLLALLASVSFANQVTLFKHSSGEGWPAFEQALIKEGKLKDGAFPTKVLSETAHNYAQEKGLPQGKLEKEEFHTLFLMKHNLGETIKVTEFRPMGQAGKFFLDDLVVRTATMVTEAPATPVAPASAVPVAAAPAYGGTFQVSPDAAQAVAITNMEGRVKTLQEEVAKSGSNQKEVAALTKRLGEFGKQLKELSDGQVGFVQQKEIDAIEAKFTKLQEEALPALRSQVNGFNERVDGVEGRLSTMEGNPMLAMGNWLFAALGLLLLLVAIVAGIPFLLRKRTNADVKKVDDELKVVRGIAQEAQGLAQKANTQSAAAVTKVVEVEGEVKKLAGRREVSFPLDFDAKMDGLTEAGQKCHLTVMVDDDRECHLVVSLRSDNLYDIAGIKDLTTGVSRKALKKTIGNAATIIDGESRLIGVPPKSVESLKSAPESVSEQFVMPSTDAVPPFLLKRVV